MRKRRIAILGSTGSVGSNALRIVADRRDRFEVACLSANSRGDELARQAASFLPASAALTACRDRPSGLPTTTTFHHGAEGILAALEESAPDVVLNAITGAAGLAASEWTVRRGLTLALANKESLVMAGSWLMPMARASGATILPVDSEHCAIHQCLRGEDLATVRRIHLTASGGPFRTRELATFSSITVEEAMKHPTWSMGPRITVGSATMMNKAFEVVEAHWLFGLEADRIQVVVHPQSIVHSMVEFVDGSMMAQLGLPDMRVPILYCLAHPDRIPFDFQPFDPVRWSRLEFEPVDPARYPAVPLAFEVLARGGDSGAVLNAADEELTAQFLAGRIPFQAIVATVERVVRSRPARAVQGVDDVMAADADGRRLARELVHAAG
ncbi:MAG: hypothetical protein RL148_2356 [Planctomycetota bacterium]